jgi:hypothetical protein
MILFRSVVVISATNVQAQCTATSAHNPGTATSSSFAGSDFSFSNPLNCLLSDGNYATAGSLASLLSGTTDYLQATDFGFSIPAAATICGIQVNVERSAFGLLSTASVKDNSIYIVKGGSRTGTAKASASSWPSTDAVATYGSSSDLWGTGFLASEINAADFGVAVSADIHGLLVALVAVTPIARINNIQITVYYQQPSTLPLQLTSFDVSGSGANTALLRWTIAGESAANSFTVERSADGSAWEALTGAPVKDLAAASYSYVDTRPLPRQSYYRLKRTAPSGVLQYSGVKAYNPLENNVIKCYPNPAASYIYITGAQPGTAVLLTDMYGHPIPVVVKQFGNNPSRVDISHLKPGMYFINTGNGQLKVQKL